MQILDPAPTSRSRRESETMLPLPPRLLAAIAVAHAASAQFDMLGEPGPEERVSARVHLGATHDIWLIRWAAGSRTVMHDHGGSAGAFYVAGGDLVEHRPDPAGTGRLQRRRVRTHDHRVMPAAHVHEVVNESNVPAASIHVYSPPLATMHHYDLTDDAGLRMMRREIIHVDTLMPHGTAADG